MSFPVYPSYKATSALWLGKVPKHWDVLRLKYACEVFPSNVDKHARDGEPPVRLCNYTDVYYNEHITADMSFMEATASEEQITRFTLKRGDTIITKDSETADDIAIAAYVPEDLPGVVCGYHLSMVRPRGSTCGAFVKRLFDSIYVKARFEVTANGLTRVGLGQYALDNVELPFPPPFEQQLIAAFLDRETAKIDALVEEQRRLIELLKEKRQAVISQAVTKGLDPNVPMKDSGVEWLGQVPAHWRVLKAAYVGRLFGSDQVEEAMVTDSGALPFIKVASLDGEGLRIKSWDWFIDSSIERFSVPKTDFVVFPKRGAAIFLNKVNVVDRPALIDPNLMGWEMNGEATSHFVALCLKVRRLDELADVSTVPQINNKHIYPEKFPVPPLVEQRAITTFLDDLTRQIDSLVTEAARAMNTLRERRSALISAAVTGKIDVRGLAPQPTGQAA